MYKKSQEKGPMRSGLISSLQQRIQKVEAVLPLPSTADIGTCMQIVQVLEAQSVQLEGVHLLTDKIRVYQEIKQQFERPMS